MYCPNYLSDIFNVERYVTTMSAQSPREDKVSGDLYLPQTQKCLRKDQPIACRLTGTNSIGDASERNGKLELDSNKIRS
jgi:hypothetical protein